ncbi:hypothetical protein LZ318_26290 [Saccharopolyspora indica]|uniref:hypothetical protein n=1 Tax=Saccharopolyspora indica TaxID=1229659 RepID=UPI0022EA5101|nr:hypothetical protein [Saccharopolyspora indica]MDA3648956.1 hypothetical protein [Saccharopolyspora indica]
MKTLKAAGLATALTTAALSLSGCGLFGGSWDVKMEVRGQGTAQIRAEFPGERVEPQTRSLPFSESRNVGFGFMTLDVADAPPGTVCRLLIDEKVVAENPVDASGRCGAEAHNKDD